MHDPKFETIAERIVDFKEINRKPEVADGQILVGEGDGRGKMNRLTGT